MMKRSPDLLNNVKIGQGRLRLFWSSDLNIFIYIYDFPLNSHRKMNISRFFLYTRTCIRNQI